MSTITCFEDLETWQIAREISANGQCQNKTIYGLFKDNRT